MAEDDETPPEEPREESRSRPLSPWERFSAALVGVAMIGGGGTAVFFREVESGPTALIAIGAVLVVMAVTGSPITRAKFGDNEVNLARRHALEVIETSQPEGVEAAIEVMRGYDPASAVEIELVRAVISQQSERDWLNRMWEHLYARYGERARREVRLRENNRVDFMVDLPAGKIAVETSFSQFRPSAGVAAQLAANRLLAAGFPMVLIVGRVALAESDRVAIREMGDRAGGKVDAIHLTDNYDALTLISAIERLAMS